MLKEKFLNEYLKDKNDINLHKYEVWYNKENRNKFNEIHKLLNDKGSGIPYLIIGNNSITGFTSESTPDRIRSTINYYKNIDYTDKVGIYLGVISENNDNQIQ